MKRATWILPVGVLLFLSTIILTPVSSQAQTNRYWIGDPLQSGNGDWGVDTNWNTDPGGSGSSGIPEDGDNVFLNRAGTTVNYIFNGSDRILTYVEVSAGGVGTTISQTDGMHFTGDLVLGRFEGGIGTYNLSGLGELNTVSTKLGHDWTLADGYGGTGIFKQDGGTHNSIDLQIGSNGGVGNPSTGQYDLINGTLTTSGRTLVGSGGTLNQSGGTHQALTLYVFSGGGATGGVYNLSGNSSTILNASELVVFDGGVTPGTFNQSGGTLTTGETRVGSNVESLDRSPATFNQTGGTHITTSLVVGNSLSFGVGGVNTSSNGIYTLSQGTLQSDSSTVGKGGKGTFNQTGGTHVTTSLVLGENAGSEGFYNLIGTGAVKVFGNTTIGKSGIGSFTQDGGILEHTGGNLVIAAFPGSSGTYRLMNGELIADNIFNSGTFDQQGGSVFTVGVINSASGTYNYSGGTLSGLGGITNQGNFKLSGPGTRIVYGAVTNEAGARLEIFQTQAQFLDTTTNYGVVKVTGSTVNWTAGVNFFNNGVYNSDPSKNYFNNLIVGATGYLLGGAGDEFYISGNFLNNSTNPLWNTALADLFFTGNGTHIFSLAGFAAGNTWDTLSLLDGGILNLSSDMLASLFISSFSGDLSKIFNTGLYDIFIYDNGGLLARLPGSQQAVPEPATMLLLGSGLLGLAGYGRKRFKKN